MGPDGAHDDDPFGTLVLDDAFVRAAVLQERLLAGHPASRARTARVRETAVRTAAALAVLVVLALPRTVPTAGGTGPAAGGARIPTAAGPTSRTGPLATSAAPSWAAIAPEPIRLGPAPIDLTP